MTPRHILADSRQPPVRTVAVIPALDEARAIGSVVLLARTHVDDVVVVDDGSTDATPAIAALAGALVERHARNAGKGAALRTGIERALKEGADRIVLLDADGQHDAREIPTLLRGLDEGAHLVVGVRTKAGEGAPTRRRRLGRSMLDRATNAVGGLEISDTQSGFRALTAAAAGALLPTVAGMGVESRMLLEGKKRGMRIIEVAISEHYPADVEPHVAPLRHGTSVLASVLSFVRDEHPLALFGTAGLALLVLGSFFGWQTAAEYYTQGVFWPGKAMEAALALTLGSIGLITGLILDFLAARLPPRARG